MGRDLREKEKNIMTKREFYEAIVNGTMNDELKETAASYIEKMDASNAARKTKLTAKQVENEELKGRIAAVLTEAPQTASEICGQFEIKVQKASALLRQLVEAGKASAVEVKIPKKGMQKGYTKVSE